MDLPQSPIDDPKIPNTIVIGRLEVKSPKKGESGSHDIFCSKEILIGRDPRCCQLLFDDLTVSFRHLKIYSVIFEESGQSEVKPLVYAEDLSSNGSYWNGSLIGRGNNGVLLSNLDEIRVSQRISVIFHSVIDHDVVDVDEVQQSDTKHFDQTYHITTRKLGTGRYGTVYLAVNRRMGRQLACKVVDLPKISNGLAKPKLERLAMRFRCEVNIMKDLSHPNVIRLEKVFQTDDTFYIFEELIAGGDLFSYVQYKGGHLHEAEAGVILRQVTEALKYLHSKQIIHRDVKPENILIASLVDSARIVLTDFGSAVRAVSLDGVSIKRMETLLGTRDYAAPEVLGCNQQVKERGYTKAVDMWSLGCVAIALLTGAPPFAKSRGSDSRLCAEESVLKTSAEYNLDKLDSIPEWNAVGRRAKGFVKALLLLDERKRMTAPEALSHEWFTNVHHKASFDAVYDRAIHDWKPTKPRSDIVEKIDRGLKSKTLSKNQPYVSKKKKWKSVRPIEPHFYPVHRNVDQILSPLRQRTPLPTITEVINEEKDSTDQSIGSKVGIPSNHSENQSISRRWGGLSNVKTLKIDGLNQPDDPKKKAGKGTRNSEEQILLNESQSSIPRSSLPLRENKSKGNIVYNPEELEMWAELNELPSPKRFPKVQSALVPRFSESITNFEGSTLGIEDFEPLGVQGHLQYSTNGETADTCFIPINRRKSIKLGDLDDTSKISPLARVDRTGLFQSAYDSPLLSKRVEAFHRTRNLPIHELDLTNEQNDITIPDSQPIDDETSTENRKRRRSSIYDEDEEEASIYTDVGKEKRFFRTARSFGQAVARKREQKGLHDKQVETSADLTDSIRTAG